MFRVLIITTSLSLLGLAGCEKKDVSNSSQPAAPAHATQAEGATEAAKTPKAAQAAPKAAAKPETETPTPAVPTPEPAKVDVKVAKEVAPAAEASTPEPGAPTSIKGFVALLKSALEATAKCERREGTVAPKNVNTCLKDIYAIKKKSWTPPKEFFPDWNAKKALRDALGKVYAESLSHKNQTVVYSALRAGWSSLDNSEATYKKLEKMLNGSDKDLAEQAAYARFSRKVKDDEVTLNLAKSVLKEHKHERVRLQGCRYIGSKVFAGDKAHFKLLTTYGRDKAEAKAVRACAVSQLGVIGNEKDVSKIVRFMKEKDLQYAVVYALGRGIRTKAAYDAYLNFFLKKAPKGELTSSPFTIFIPGKRDMDKFDTKKATKILAIALKAPGELKYWIPSLLGKLGAKEELEDGLKGLGDTAGDWNKETLKKEFDKALAKLAANTGK